MYVMVSVLVSSVVDHIHFCTIKLVFVASPLRMQQYKPSKFSMDKDLNMRRLNPFKTNINIVRYNFKNQSQQTDLRKHFSGETYTPMSNTMNQSLRENNT